jgi:hypothetical protein
MRNLILSLSLLTCAISFSQPDLSESASGIYFENDEGVTSLDPTLVNVIKGSRFLVAYGRKQNSIAQIDGQEANYTLSFDAKFYFKFNPESKSLNSSNSNSTETNSNENYIDLLYAGANSKAISPNEFKLVKMSLKKGKRSFINGKYGLYGLEFEPSVDFRAIVNFKYKKITENIYEVWFPKDLEPGEYCFYYLGGFSEEFSWIQSNNIKVFDFRIE